MTTITSLATRNRGAEPLDEQLNVLEVTNFDEPVCHEFTMYQLVYGDRVICDTMDSNQARRLLGSLKTQTSR